MRTKPLLQPVVKALERQERINIFLLQLINEMREQIGLEPIAASAIESIIDGSSSGTSISAPPAFNPAPVAPATPAQPAAPVAAVDPAQPTAPTAPAAPEAPAATPGASAAPAASAPVVGELRYLDNLHPSEDSDSLGYGCDYMDLTDEPDCYIFITTDDDDKAWFQLNPDFAEILMRNDHRHAWKHVVEIEGGDIPVCPDGKKYVISNISPGDVRFNGMEYLITSKAKIKISVQ